MSTSLCAIHSKKNFKTVKFKKKNCFHQDIKNKFPLVGISDLPFHNSGASKSVARSFWTTQSSPISRSWGAKIVKGPVWHCPFWLGPTWRTLNLLPNPLILWCSYFVSIDFYMSLSRFVWQSSHYVITLWKLSTFSILTTKQKICQFVTSLLFYS